MAGASRDERPTAPSRGLVGGGVAGLAAEPRWICRSSAKASMMFFIWPSRYGDGRDSPSIRDLSAGLMEGRRSPSKGLQGRFATVERCPPPSVNVALARTFDTGKPRAAELRPRLVLQKGSAKPTCKTIHRYGYRPLNSDAVKQLRLDESRRERADGSRPRVAARVTLNAKVKPQRCAASGCRRVGRSGVGGVASSHCLRPTTVLLRSGHCYCASRLIHKTFRSRRASTAMPRP
jgi:hypothetical protein